jgi:O-antigen/teichoic acid export membrane protein
MLPLEALGYYNLAYTAASTVAFVVGAIGSAALPSFAAAQGRSAPAELLERYRAADRAMLSLVGVVAFALLFHGELILGWWINPAAAAAARTSLSLLIVGFWIGAAINNVYNVAVACGVPGRHLRVNILTVVPYAAIMYLLIGLYGATGAALAWVLLNLAYAVLLVPAIHHRVLRTSTRRWLLGTVLPFIVLGVASFGVPALIAEAVFAGRTGQAGALCVSVLVYSLAAFFLFMARPADAASLRMLLTRPRA